MRLFLIRHGQTEWNNSSRAQGHTDIALDHVGQKQADLLGKRFEGESISRIIASDLLRARHTAGPIAAAIGVPLELLPGLRERGFGDWEGRYFVEINAAFSASAEGRIRLRPPRGESLEDVWRRTLPIAQELLEAREPVVVVTHGGALSLLLAQLLGAPIEVSASFRFANTGVTELGRLADGRWHLAKYNDTRHLESVHEFEDTLVGSVDGTVR
jgi:probable phosphoglycerate mutase